MSDSKIVNGLIPSSDSGEDFFLLVKNCFKTDYDFAEAVLASFRIKATMEINRRAKKSEKGFVYFIYDKGLCKIGKTKNKPENRYKSLCVGNPTAVFLGAIATENRTLLEAQLHERFSKRRQRGEWFKISVSTVKGIIKELSK